MKPKDLVPGSVIDAGRCRTWWDAIVRGRRPQYHPSPMESQIAELLQDSPAGVGLFVLGSKDLRESYPWMAVIRVHSGASV